MNLRDLQMKQPNCINYIRLIHHGAYIKWVDESGLVVRILKYGRKLANVNPTNQLCNENSRRNSNIVKWDPRPRKFGLN